MVYKFFNLLFVFFLVLLSFSFIFFGSGFVILLELDVLSSSVLNFNIPFMLDLYSVMFMGVVTTISGCVMYYNGFYMDSEIFYSRFCKLVLLFVLSMLFLIMIPNMLGLMIGWDGLGLTSYLLVIYYQDKRSLGSGTLTVLSNRIGDVLFFISISLISSLSSWNFIDISAGWYISGLCGVTIIGCMTKSAQIPFSAWLPAAMAAPSPVSALVHSSTLVTAGVFVLVRFSGSISGGWYLFLGVVSSMTMLMSAISAVFEPDAKKVVALSTLSQLGVMMLAVSVGSISVCFFHLVSHALFKALMFLCVGSVIHFSGIQDLRYLGGFIYSSPIIMSWLMVACLSLGGFPFLSGFFSKDLVIEAFLEGGFSLVLLVMVFLSTCLTAVYSGMMVFSVFFRSVSMGLMGGMVSPSYITFPCSVLGVGALTGGFAMQLLIIDFNNAFGLFNFMKLMPISCVFTGFFFLLVVYMSVFSKAYEKQAFNSAVSRGELLYTMMSKMWFMPPLSSDSFSDLALSISGDIKSLAEDGYLEHSFGGNFIFSSATSVSSAYMGSQVEDFGLCLLKGLILLVSGSLFFLCLNIYDK